MAGSSALDAAEIEALKRQMEADARRFLFDPWANTINAAPPPEPLTLDKIMESMRGLLPIPELPTIVIVPDEDAFAQLAQAFPNGELAGMAVRIDPLVPPDHAWIMSRRDIEQTPRMIIPRSMRNLPTLKMNAIKIDDTN